MKQPHEPDSTSADQDAINQKVQELSRSYINLSRESHRSVEDEANVLTTILESLGDGIFVRDTDANLLLANSAANKLVGKRFNANWMQQWADEYEVFEADGVTKIEPGTGVIKQAMLSGKRVETEHLIVSRNLGSQGQWFRVVGTPIFDQSGSAVAGVCVVSNITEQKKAHERLKDLYDNAPCAYLSMDGNGMVTAINNTALRLLDCVNTDVIGKRTFIEFIKPEDRGVFTNAFATLIKTGSITNIELRIITTTGSERIVLWSSNLAPFDDGNGSISRCTLTDVTERVRLRQQLDRLAAIVTHDIKNHLFSVGGFCKMFVELQPEKYSAEDIDTFQALTLSTEDCLRMVTNLMEIYRLENRPESIARDTRDIITLLDEAITSATSFARIRGIQLVKHFCAEPLLVKADPAVTHVFLNLAHNAIKYSAAGSTVDLEAKAEGDNAVVRITDCGPGLNDAERSALFQPFWQGQGKVDQSSGTGLGLYLAQQLVHAHGGQLRCESTVGKGTTFVVSLPLA